ncbi:tetratricopeptide repeat protein [Streptomyces mirabilis]|uniref:tetratricopeptide repeat protein n=1 Tax=Streptomyces mirabilis TaxID=68239 RepID=UPI0033FA986E
MSHARVAPELSWFWRLRGLHGEWAATARELLAAVGAEPPAGLAEEYVLCVINALSGESDDPADQRRLARVEDALADLSRPPRQEQFAGRPTASEESFAPSLAGFRATGDRWGLASCLGPLAMFADWRGDHRHALELLDEGLSYVRELAAPEETSVLLRTRATVLLHQGEPVEAREHFSQALTPAPTVGLADKVAGALRGPGDAARLAGDTGHARVRYESALEACAANWFGMGRP